MSNPSSADPMALTPIPYGKQTLGQTEIDAVVQVLKSAFLTQGPIIEQFENTVASFCQVPYAVAFSSGTAALHAACAVAGLGPGDEAVTTPITFVATSNAVLYQQAKPVFADIDPDTWNLAPERAAARITSRTKALMPVHFGGEAADLEAFYALADQHNLVVIEDACHALGGTYQGRPIGQCRDMAVFSFHPVKSITTGEGGMVVTPHRHYYEALLRFRTHGITRDTTTFTAFAPEPWVYEMQALGFNYRLTDIQAALGIVQMTHLTAFVQQRHQLVQRYRQALGNLPGLRFQVLAKHNQSAHHLAVVRLDPVTAPVNRRQLYDALVTQNIRPQVHYLPVHLQPYYQQALATRPGDYPEAEAYSQHCLSLPLYPTLSDAEQERVINTIRTVWDMRA